MLNIQQKQNKLVFNIPNRKEYKIGKSIIPRTSYLCEGLMNICEIFTYDKLKLGLCAFPDFKNKKFH